MPWERKLVRLSVPVHTFGYVPPAYTVMTYTFGAFISRQSRVELHSFAVALPVKTSRLV